MTKKEKERHPEDFLETFKSVEDLRKYLVDKGYKGHIEDGVSCPLANCLRKEFVNITSLYIDENHHQYRNEMSFFYDRYTPRIAKEFIIAFDRGDFPELVLPREEDVI